MSQSEDNLPGGRLPIALVCSVVGLALVSAACWLMHSGHVAASRARANDPAWQELRSQASSLRSSLQAGRPVSEAETRATKLLSDRIEAAQAVASRNLESVPSSTPWILLGVGTGLLLVPVGVSFHLLSVGRAAVAKSRKEAEDKLAEASKAAQASLTAERKKAESDRVKLNEARNRLELVTSVLETVPVVIWAIDAEGRYLLREGRSLLECGVKLGEGVGLHFSEVKTIRPATDENMRRALAGETFAAEYREGDRWFNTRFSPLCLADGTLAGVCGVSADITTRKRADALAAQEEGIRNAARLKTEFMSNMSHELRTPMNGIVGMVGLLGSTNLSEEQQGMLDVIQQSTDSLLKTVNDLIDLSKLETGKVKLAEAEFSPHALVRSLLDVHAPAANKKGVELITDIDAASRGKLVGDPDRVSQIVGNLLENAVKFTPKGHVLVQMRTTPNADGKMQLCITISDTGVGIEASKLPELLKPYAGEKKSFARRVGDVGFGLAITKMIVGLMGGTLTLDSEPGRGATATIFLSLSSAEVGSPPRADFTGRRFLIVDDSELARGLLALRLSACGATVDVCDSSQAALTRCLEHADKEPYSLVLVDRFMPRVDGAAFAALVRAEKTLKGLPLVLLTPAVDPLEPGKRSLFQAELIKPVEEADLLGVVERALTKARVAPPQAAPVPATPAPAAAKAARSLRLLVADDNVVNQAVCRRTLEKLGHTVHVVSNGREVVDLVQRERFDAVFMDCQMPDIDGYEATRRLRCAPAPAGKIWIIAVTANASVSDRENCFAAGMNDFIAKPLRLAVVEASLAKIPG